MSEANTTDDQQSTETSAEAAADPTPLDEYDTETSATDEELDPDANADGGSDDEYVATPQNAAESAAPPITQDGAPAAEDFERSARDAIRLDDSGQFFRVLAESANRIAALRQTLLPLLREYAREGVSEAEALAELVELYADGADEVRPVITALSTRALLRVLRRRGTPVVDAAQVAQVARSTEEAARSLAERRGRRALHDLPQLLARATTRAAAATARTYRRRFRIPGPVEIVIYDR